MLISAAGMRHATPLTPVTSWKEELLEVVLQDLDPVYDELETNAQELLNAIADGVCVAIDRLASSFFSVYLGYPFEKWTDRRLEHDLPYKARELHFFRDSFDLKQSEITQFLESVFTRLQFDFFRYMNQISPQ